MKKIILLATIALALFSCKKKDEPVTPPVVDPFAGKECVTMDATNVTQVSATINGYFLPNDNKESTQNYFYFLISQNKDILNADEIIKKENDDVWIIGPETEEEMIPDQNHQVHYNCTGVLTPGTTYYIRALIYSVKEAEEGEEGKEDFIHADNIISFTTKSFDAGKTKVTTQDVTNAGPFKATLSATLTSDAGADIVRRGGWFLYGPAGSTLEELKAMRDKLQGQLSQVEQDIQDIEKTIAEAQTLKEQALTAVKTSTVPDDINDLTNQVNSTYNNLALNGVNNINVTINNLNTIINNINIVNE